MDDLDRALRAALKELTPDEFEASLGRLRGVYWSRADEADLQARIAMLHARLQAEGGETTPTRSRVPGTGR